MKIFDINESIGDSSFQFAIGKTYLINDLPIHSHNFSELVFLLGGSGTHLIDNKEYSVEVGDVYVFNSNSASHGFKNVRNLFLCNIIYNPQRIMAYNNELKSMKGFQALFMVHPNLNSSGVFKSRLHLSTETLIIFDELLERMISEFTARKEGYMTIILGYVMEVIVLLSREYEMSENTDNLQLLRLAETMAYIEKNYTNHITLDSLIEISHFSKRHLIRLFKQIYNTTPIDYILELRLKHACALLHQNNKSIKEIAMDSGFNDINYFSKFFRKKYGASPKKYLK